MINELSFGEKNYPSLLKEIPDPPKKLYYRGDFQNDVRPHLAIVGTRKATAAGLQLAKKFAKELAARGMVIVSGLAMGIDTAAHEGALEAKGKTIAVLGNGLDSIYPRQNEKLSNKILEVGGVILSEYEIGTPAYKDNFLQRNRIVSGLSLGILVIEAPTQSGALNTASHALEQNREVFVVPGPLNNENYLGSHALLRAGARLVTKPEEILDDLNLSPGSDKQQNLFVNNPGLNENQKALLTVLQRTGEPVSVDKIQELTKMDVSAINRNLTFLLIQSIVKEEGGRYFISL